MFRKLTFLALLGGVAAYFFKIRGGGVQEVQPSTSPQQASDPTPETVAEVRPAQTADTVETAPAGVGDDERSVIPDTADDDPLVREQEQAAAAEAGTIGGPPDATTAEAPPEMQPVEEGSGDAQETFEATEDQGR